ncbi:hypothetical protein [Flavobacterium paronense]|uniref:hypothetical protein n=1 Tax=Flavobacterium paronense TaxID=1392775 RepID=UPI003F6AB330
MIYKRVINRLVEMIEAYNPNYAFSKSLASSIVEGSLHQHFLKIHLKPLPTVMKIIHPQIFYLHLIENTLNRA